MSKKPKNDKSLSQKYAVSMRTIRNWRRDKAPLTDESRMRLWLASRRHIPASCEAALSAVKLPMQPPAAKADGPALATGAGAALARLESCEASSYARLQEALTSGDDLQIKNARSAWLAVGSQLRHYDLAVTEARRQGGELIPRADVEKWLAEFAWLWRCAVGRNSEALAYNTSVLSANDPMKALGLLKNCDLSRLVGSMAALNALIGVEKQVPDWWFEGMLKQTMLADPAGEVKQRRELFEGVWVQFEDACQRGVLEQFIKELEANNATA